MTLFTILLMLFLAPASAFAGFLPDSGFTSQSNAPQTLEGCFAAGGDPGSRSGCIMEVAANEKDVVLCDLIEIPGMEHDCIDGVAAVTKISPDKCKIMKPEFRDHCTHASA